MKTALTAISIAALQIFAAPCALAATSRITCTNQHSFNYGKLDLIRTDTEATITMSSTNLGQTGRKLIGEKILQTRQVKMKFPAAECILSEVSTRLPARCYNSIGRTVIEITDQRGTVHPLAVGYAALDLVVRDEETVDQPLTRRFIAQVNIMEGSHTHGDFKEVSVDVAFESNECSRIDTP